MNIVKKGLAELPIIEESNINTSSVSEALIEAEDGTVFIVDKDGLFKGIITIGDYLRNQLDNIKLEPNNKCKFIYNNQDILENLDIISFAYPNIRIVPILDCENKLLYAYSLPIDYPKIYSELRDTLFKLKIEKPFCLYDYLKEESANKVAIWGANDLSLEIYDELKRYNNLNEVKLCETIGGGDIEKTDIDIEYLKSIKELIQDTNFDIIIVANLKFKNQSKIFEDLRIKYIDDIIYEIKNQDNYLEYYKLIAILYRLKMENIYGVSNYLLENDYKNIAIWGVNELSLLLGAELNKCNATESVCVYGNISIRKKIIRKIDTFDFDVDVKWIKSIKCIIGSYDLIIISDLNKLINPINKNIVYIGKILNEITLKIYQKNIERCCITLNNMNVHTMCVAIPEQLTNLKFTTKQRIEKFKGVAGTDFLKVLSDKDIEDLFGTAGSNYISKFSNIYEHSMDIIVKKFGRTFWGDCKSKYFNVINGERIVPNNPTEYDNCVYLIGPCIVEGCFSHDNDTIGFYLQNALLEFGVKYGVRLLVQLDYHADLVNFIDNLNLRDNDIVIFIYYKRMMPFPYIDMTSAFNKLYKKEEFFFDGPVHCTYKGYKVIAEEIFKYLIKSNFLATQKSDSNKLCLNNNIEIEKRQKRVFEGNRDLLNYVDKLKTFRVEENKVIGSIVMNCNPFTLGHRYLIEQSLKNVDWLYIFVVEEDKSMFSFEDRFRLIQENTKDLNNITIVPSGNFIISSKTFSAYFSKDTPTETKIDTSTDIEVFAQHIVPALNINTRFVGEEPFDIVTNQYNRSMKDILPKYGVEVRVIPRKKFGEEVISASTVRKLLKQKDFNKIKNFVPSATYNFLLKLMSSKNQI